MSEIITPTKKELLEEIRLKNKLQVRGLNFDPTIFNNLDVGGEYTEQVNALFAPDRHEHKDFEFPSYFVTEKGKYHVQIRWNQSSPYLLSFEDGKFQIAKSEKHLIEDVQFAKRSYYYGLFTSDGTPMRTVAQDYGHNNMFVAYSNECSLKDKGKDCLFCNINATKSIYAESQNIKWKTAKQIGETIAAGYAEGFNKMTVSGGFIPERREVDYYIDVAEAIQEATGLSDFNGTACVGAPIDLSVIEKYKEAGYRTIATNLEIWNEKMFDVICPGKADFCGGRQNWLDALDYELKIFGKFKVRSTFVSGIEPKESLLEGLEYLVSKGIVALPSQWNVNVGSPLEGHRTPVEEWHWDVFERTVAIYRKHGLTWNLFRDATANADTIVHDLFRLEEGVSHFDIDKR